MREGERETGDGGGEKNYKRFILSHNKKFMLRHSSKVPFDVLI